MQAKISEASRGYKQARDISWIEAEKNHKRDEILMRWRGLVLHGHERSTKKYITKHHERETIILVKPQHGRTIGMQN